MLVLVYQVPKGWDKLFISVISAENGKTIAKSSRVQVRNGGCQWADSISESIWVPKSSSSKDIGDCVLKLVVATVLLLLMLLFCYVLQNYSESRLCMDSVLFKLFLNHSKIYQLEKK